MLTVCCCCLSRVCYQIKHLGGLRLVLETKFNMLKLREGGETVAGSLQRNTSISSRTTVDTRQQHYSDEERPESPESSPDEDFTPLRKKKDVDVRYAQQQSRIGSELCTVCALCSSPSNVRRKDYYLGLMEKIAGSKVFQEIAQHNVVKKVMEGRNCCSVPCCIVAINFMDVQAFLLLAWY